MEARASGRGMHTHTMRRAATSARSVALRAVPVSVRERNPNSASFLRRTRAREKDNVGEKMPSSHYEEERIMESLRRFRKREEWKYRAEDKAIQEAESSRERWRRKIPITLPHELLDFFNLH